MTKKLNWLGDHHLLTENKYTVRKGVFQIRFDAKSVNRGLPVWEQPRGSIPE